MTAGIFTWNVMEADSLHSGGAPANPTEAVMFNPPRPVVSTVISSVPWPVVIAPADNHHLNSGFVVWSMEVFTFNASGAPGSTWEGPSISTIPHLTDVWALAAEASVSNKATDRIWISLPIDERIEWVDEECQGFFAEHPWDVEP